MTKAMSDALLCTTRKRFKTKKKAMIHRRKMTSPIADEDWYRVYECPECKGWHLGFSCTSLPHLGAEMPLAVKEEV